MSDLFQEETVTTEDLNQEAAATAEAPAADPTKPARRPRKTAAEKEAEAEAKAAERAAKAAQRAAEKAAKAAEPKAPPAPRDIVAGLVTYGLSDTITVLAPTNPKRGASAARFDLYKSGQTVSEALAAGVLRADIVWDAGRGFITVTPAVVAEAA